MADSTSHAHTNSLITEKSPYLLQHAHNPVDWFPWSELAFEKSKNENKPIFLSVGYSTCHWCHVMEHECFESEEVAAIMNKHFINIKVDREENPGVDKLYMTYVQLISGNGGWPMSVFLTPERYPFFGGTYFPPEDRYGRPGFKSLLKRVAQIWTTSPDKVRSNGKNMMSEMKAYIEVKPTTSSKLPEPMAVAATMFDHFQRSFDEKFGGFGTAPKFPTPVQIRFLLEYHFYNKGDAAMEALSMATFTLKKIAMGGIHDHVGSGFHRYSTDQKWHVPHFEKMLYDQAQLLSAYSIAYQITGMDLFKTVIQDIIQYVVRDLQHQEGGFYSAEDADSYPDDKAEKKLEGAFCVWESSELDELLGEQSTLFKSYFGVSTKGNADSSHDPQGELKNKNILYIRKPLEDLAKEFEITVEEASRTIEEAKTKLWEHRLNARPKPHRDNKIVTSWNGLMVSGLSHAYEAIHDEKILDIAERTVSFIRNELYQSDTTTLRRSYCDGPSSVEGFIDDYSYLIQGLLDLYEVTFNEDHLKWALELQEKQNELFYDNDGGGYFNVPEHDKSVLLRLKDEQDGAEPSANAVSARNLVRLASFFHSTAFTEKAEQTVGAFQLALGKFPYALPALVSSFILLATGPKEVILAGSATDESMRKFRTAVSKVFMPNRTLIQAKFGGFLCSKNTIVGDIAEKASDQAKAYICENYTCGLPIHDETQLMKALCRSDTINDESLPAETAADVAPSVQEDVK